MWNLRVGMIGCRPIEMWWWRGWDVRVEGGRLGMNVWRMIWRCLVYILNGPCSGICGEASYWKERLALAECGRNGCFKNKWWWWCTINFRLHIYGQLHLTDGHHKWECYICSIDYLIVVDCNCRSWQVWHHLWIIRKYVFGRFCNENWNSNGCPSDKSKIDIQR